MHQLRTPRRTVGVAALLMLLLAACGSDEDSSAAPSAEPETTETTEAEAAEDGFATPDGATEVGASAPRLAITYDGGVQVLDGTTLEVLADEDFDGYTRLNPAGDGRHFLVTAEGGFHVLDGGAWGEPHGDHSHFYTGDPGVTGTVFEAEVPAHVVNHAGRTVLFDDGTGDVTAFDSDEIEDADRDARTYTTPAPHHGVAVELSDGRMVVSEGDEDGRNGIRVLDEDDEEIAASDECPDVHGETVASDETVVIGCSDGVLIYRDGEITKVQSPDAYGRIGNQFGTEDSSIVLGDYKSDPDAEIDLTTRVALIDVETAELRLVDLPASYWYRSLGRGERGEGVVLGIDGALHVIDTDAGEVVRSVPVIDPWEISENWQDPQPQVFTMQGTAYITDPAGTAIHAVDIETGEIWASAELDVVPNELKGVTGEADDHGHDDHDHADDHEHDDDEHDDE